MKKVISIILSLCLALSLVACNTNNSTAKSVVTSYCEALKELNIQKMANCTGKDIKPIDINSLDDNYVKDILEYIKTNAKKIKYTIVDEKVEGDETYITVDFEYIDLSLAFSHAVVDLLKDSIALALSGDMDEDKMTEILVNSINDYLKNNKEVVDKKTIVFTCEKNESKWLITDVDTVKLMDVVTGGIMSAISKLTDAFK